MLVPSHNHKLEEVICPKRRRLILSSNGTRQFESGAWLGSSSFGRSRSLFIRIHPDFDLEGFTRFEYEHYSIYIQTTNFWVPCEFSGV